MVLTSQNANDAKKISHVRAPAYSDAGEILCCRRLNLSRCWVDTTLLLYYLTALLIFYDTTRTRVRSSAAGRLTCAGLGWYTIASNPHPHPVILPRGSYQHRGGTLRPTAHPEQVLSGILLF